MAFIGSMLGAGQGSDFVAAGSPAPAAINPTSQDQISNAYNSTGNSLLQQQQLLMALQQQQGLQNQSDVYRQLQGVASGNGPNPAQAQFQQNANQVAAQTAGLIGSQKGMSPALQARLVAEQGAGARQGVAGQAATLQAQQQLGALNAMGNMANTQASNQIGQTNAVVGSQMGEQGELLNAMSGYNNANAGILSNVNNTNSATQIQNSKAQQGIFGGLLGGAGGILSDENSKTGVRPADDQIQQFLDNVGAHEYSYKQSVQGHPGTAPGRHVGPMAQELEKSDLGRQMVINTPDGKGVDFSRGLGTIIAAQATLNKRLEALEGKKMAGGGMVAPQNYDTGGMAGVSPTAGAFPMPFNSQGPQSSIGKFLNGIFPNQQQQQPIADGGGEGAIGSGMKDLIKGGWERFNKLNSGTGAAPSSAPVTPQTGMAPLQGNPSVPLSSTPGAFEGSEGALGADEAAGLSSASEAEGLSGAAAAGEAGEAAEGAGSASELVAALAKGGRVNNSLGAFPKKLNGEKYARKMKPVPGKPKVRGDSEKNDTVPAKLSPGEIIIPRSIAMHQNAPELAAKFVAAVKAKQGRGIG